MTTQNDVDAKLTIIMMRHLQVNLNQRLLLLKKLLGGGRTKLALNFKLATSAMRQAFDDAFDSENDNFKKSYVRIYQQ